MVYLFYRVLTLTYSIGPLAVKYAKLAIDNGVRSDLPTGLMLEKLCYARLIPTSDRLEGLKAFREGREAKYQGS